MKKLVMAVAVCTAMFSGLSAMADSKKKLNVKQHHQDLEELHYNAQKNHEDEAGHHDDMKKAFEELDSDLAAIPQKIEDVSDASTKAALQSICNYLSATHELHKKDHGDEAKLHGNEAERHKGEAKLNDEIAKLPANR